MRNGNEMKDNKTLILSDLSYISQEHLIEKFKDWHPSDFYPNICLDFCTLKWQTNDIDLPYSIKEGLRNGLEEILESSYPLIITSKRFRI